jgi:outer membrane protein assembly factor BamB
MQALGVVPIFMSAGAAVMPAVAGALASVAAILFKPRELLRVLREKPRVVGASAGGALLLILASAWWLTPAKAGRVSTRAATPVFGKIDWAQVAQDLIAQEQAGKTPTDPATAFAAVVPIAPLLPAAPVIVTTPTPGDPGSTAQPIIQGHDVSRTSYAGGLSPKQLKPLWNYRPEDTMFLSQPLVAGDRIYVAGCQADLGGYTGLLACLHAETGKPIWEITELNGEILLPFFSSPALSADGKSLLIGQGLHQDKNCSLLCFDASNGKLRWRVKTTLHLESSPAILGDLAVVGAGAIEGRDGRPTGDPGFVLAVRISDGKELWRQPVNDPESSPAIDADGMVFIGSGFNGCEVIAIRSDSDEQLKEKKLDRVAWRAQVPYPVTSAIALIGDYVVAGSGNGDVVHSNSNAAGLVVAMDRKTGQIRWKTQFEDSVIGGVAARDNMLICPIRTGEIAALSLEKGDIVWRTHISGTAPVLASAGFAPQAVYAVSNDGYLGVLDPKDGSLLQKVYLNDQSKAGTGLSMSAPQIVNGRVIVGSETGGVRCFVGSGSDQ